MKYRVKPLLLLASSAGAGLAFVLGQPGPDLWPATMLGVALWTWSVRDVSLYGCLSKSVLIGLLYAVAIGGPASHWDLRAFGLVAIYCVGFFTLFGTSIWAVQRRVGSAVGGALALGLICLLLELASGPWIPIMLSASLTAAPVMLWPASIGGAALLSGELVTLGVFIGGAPSWFRGLVVVALLGAQGGVGLGLHLATENEAASINVSGLQPRITTRDYRQRIADPRTAEAIVSAHGRLATAALAYRPDLLVFPEGSDGRYLFVSELLSRPFQDFAKKNQLDLVIPTNGVDHEGRLTNVAYVVRRDGSVEGPHVKTVSMPFGETGLRAGERAGPLVGSKAVLGVLICIEGVFRTPIRDLVAEGAEVLVMVTNDASFYRTWISTWHVAYAQLRSVEVGRPLVLVSNAGPSQISDAAGFVIGGAPFGSSGVFGGRIVPTSHTTVFTRLEPFIPWAAVLFLALLLGLSPKRNQTSKVTESSRMGLLLGSLATMATGGLAFILPEMLLPAFDENPQPLGSSARVWSLQDITASVEDRQTAFAAAATHLLRFYGFMLNPDEVSERMVALRVTADANGAILLLRSWGLRAQEIRQHDVHARLQAGSGPLLGEVVPPGSATVPGLALTADADTITVYHARKGVIEEIPSSTLLVAPGWFVAVVAAESPETSQD